MSLISRLNQRVRIEQPSTSSDGYGGKTVTWSAVATVFAEVVPLAAIAASAEPVVGDQPQAHAGYRVTLRSRTDVTAAMRLVWKGHTLLIHAMHEGDAVLSILAYEENL